MQTLEELRSSINTVEDMKSVVSTMKTLAAARIRHFEAAANATQAYADTVQLSLHALLLQRPSLETDFNSGKSERIGMVLMGSDQGFCGRFNEAVSDAAFPRDESTPDTASKPLVISMGAKLGRLLSVNGYEVAQTFATPGSVSKILSLVQQLIVAIDTWQREHNVSSVTLVHNCRRAASTCDAKRVELLPLSQSFLKELANQPWDSRSRPICPVPWKTAFSTVIQEYLFIQLFRAVSESLASENASRIAAMQKAEANIDERIEELNGQFNQSRQRKITEELLDIISGYEAI